MPNLTTLIAPPPVGARCRPARSPSTVARYAHTPTAQKSSVVERANGKLKRIIGKIIFVRGGSWATHRQAATRYTAATPSSW